MNQADSKISIKNNIASNIDIFEEYITCMICLEIVENPRECNICHKVFCYKCLAIWIGSSDLKCPLKCKSMIVQADSIILDILASLQYYCKNKAKGCKKVLYYNELEKHLNSCLYEKVLCPNDFCSHETLKVNLNNHTKKCDFQKVCPYCKKSINLKKFPFHRMVCNSREVKCKMCSISFSFKKYEKHKTLCKEKYLSIINQLPTSNVICEVCYGNSDKLITCKLEKMIGCYLCKSTYCDRCYILNCFLKCDGCGETCCQSHLINCSICNSLKCNRCLKKCSECMKPGICDKCLYIDHDRKSYCEDCRKCPNCKKISKKKIDKKCYICKEESTCNDCTTISNFSDKIICENKCINCNKCEYKFHDLEIIRTMNILKSIFKRKNSVNLSKIIGQFLICKHIYSTYKYFI